MKTLQISALRVAYQNGETTIEQVIATCRARAEAAPKEAWIRLLTEDELAVYVNALRGESPATKPLYGIPFVLKDNIDLAGFPTTAACPAYAYTPDRSAFVVEQLIAAGAIPLGKTNLDQFATGLVGARSPHGACPNSFDPAYISGGSSSGSSVAVALGCCSFSLGTDTAGSGRVPACFNNLVGLKPSRGLLSCSGVIPACRSLDCVSIFALDAADANAVFDVASAYDPGDSYARRLVQAPGTAETGWTFGVPPADQLNFFGNATYEAAFHESVALLERAGGIRVEIDFEPFVRAANLLYAGPWVNERYAAVGRFVDEHPDAVLETTRRIIRSGLGITAPAVFEAMYELQAYKRQADAVMADLDLLVTPTAGTCYTLEDVRNHPVELNTNLGFYTNFMNLLDYAAVVVPTVMTRPVPFGITLAAPAGHDRKLLHLASHLHRASGLTVGKTSVRPAPCPPVAPRASVELAVCGAHLKGYPLHHQLVELGASLVCEARTSPVYRMYAFEQDGLKKPGLVRDPQQGAGIYVEVYRMTPEAFGTFVARIPEPLGIGKILLENGKTVCGFIAEPLVQQSGTEITSLGDWRNYA